MSPYTCDELKREYDSIIPLRDKFLNALKKSTRVTGLGEVKKIKKEIEEKIMEVEENISHPIKIFFKILDKKETIEGLMDITEINKEQGLFWYDKYIYEQIENLFYFYSVPDNFIKNLNSRFYEKFVQQLMKRKETSLKPVEELLKKQQNWVEYFSSLPLLNSLFLNKLLDSNTILKIEEDLPRELQNYFGCFLNQGIIAVKDVRGKVGYGMTGGVIAARSVAHLFGYISREGGVVLVDGYDETGKIEIGNEVFGYDYQTHNYYLASGTYKIIHPMNKINKFRDFISGKAPLAVVDDLKAISTPTQGLHQGVLVLCQAPRKNIGEGMKGGVLIVEDPKISTTEELKKRLSPRRQGGVVLLRVHDPHNPTQTMLEIVE